jgi:hypothetical protein
MFAVHENDLCFAVETVFVVVSVVYEAGFVAESGGVDDPFAVEVEEERGVFSIVDDAATVCFCVGNYLLEILVVGGKILDVAMLTSPAYSLKKPPFCTGSPT